MPRPTPHICIMTTVHDPLDTRVFYREAQTLARAGYRVTLIAQGARAATVAGVRFRPLPPRQFSLRPRLRGLGLAWRAALDENADAYHLHDPELTPVGLLLKLAGKRVVLDIHEHTPFQLLEKTYIPPLLRIPAAVLFDAWERITARLVDRVITVGDVIARRFGPGTILVRNLPDLERFAHLSTPSAPPDPARPLTVIYTGVIEQQRGLHLAARAIANLPPEIPIRLRLVGPCPFEAYAEELQTIGQDRLTLEPPIPYAEIPTLLAQADIGLEIAQPTPLNELLWPRKVFEYMAAGLPVIRANYPRWDDFASAGTLPVDPTDEAAIRAALLRLAQDAALRASLGAAGRQLVQTRFRWENEAATLLAMYVNLVGPPVPPA